eukprot:CAMPEP_0198720452 /NCGR_PEP_ID=MMETSP1471-20131121/62163_1 /TAXON_ID=41880 /ORGANISM="Pycnococcus provasolii, Strain RCC733" /LENGTH=233 /DNA_ID=CAMNT_0044481291 /DNA_START=51 /DNA_END=749 /DNA_ORIENTATION=-
MSRRILAFANLKINQSAKAKTFACIFDRGHQSLVQNSLRLVIGQEQVVEAGVARGKLVILCAAVALHCDGRSHRPQTSDGTAITSGDKLEKFSPRFNRERVLAILTALRRTLQNLPEPSNDGCALAVSRLILRVRLQFAKVEARRSVHERLKLSRTKQRNALAVAHHLESLVESAPLLLNTFERTKLTYRSTYSWRFDAVTAIDEPSTISGSSMCSPKCEKPAVNVRQNTSST